MAQIKQVKTTKGTLHYYRDWDKYEGAIVMVDAKTIDRYKEISNEHPDADKYGIFWAFSHKQMEEGVEKLIKGGFIKDRSELCQDKGSGIIGTRSEIKRFYDFYDKSRAKIPQECDPQEVYFYEFNNHECMLGWEGDKPAYDIVKAYWGEEIAKKLIRY